MKNALLGIQKILRIALLLCSFLAISHMGWGQTVGDYRSNGSGNWGDLSTWQRLNILPNKWATPTTLQGYPGQNASPSLVTIENNNIVTLNISPANSIGSIDIPDGNKVSSLIISLTNSLAVSGAITISSDSKNDKALYVNEGSLNAASIAISSGSTQQDAFIQISTGTVTVIGDITMNVGPGENYVLFTGSGTLNIGGTLTGGGITSTTGGGDIVPLSGTVDYNKAGAQTIGDYIYNNLTLSGSGTKTFSSATTIRSDLSINSGVIASLGNYSSTADRMSIGGVEVINGSWGSSSSNPPATYQDDTYFAATTGLINITYSSCVTTAPIATGALICSGSTATLSATGAMEGGKFLWYGAETGGVPIKTSANHNDQTYMTSALATTTDFWVSILNRGRCESARTKVTATVTPLPVATFGYIGTPYCQNAANPNPTFSGGGVAGTFSSTSGLVFVSAASGQINLAASTPGAYLVTNTIAASGGCSVVTATTTVTIIADGSWTGTINADWNNPGNWACNQLPTLTSNVLIANGKPNYPTLSAGVEGAAKSLTIENAGSLTVTGNTLQIAGVISNNGIFIASEGTIEMKGAVAQTIGANVFAGNAVMNLTVNNPAGVTLQGALNVTGIVTALNGNLSSGGNLTLLSTAAQTALIDGIGAGNVLGDVNMQRYLPSAFGYKYVSSPFQSATVDELAQEVDLGATFPSFYKYDQNNSIDSSGVTVYKSGWVNYNLAGNALVPLAGYAANLGANMAAPPITANMTGIVNVGSLQVSLNNQNRKFTKGFNLVGNPYPSPIDWDATGWTKTNVDNAVYFFNASGDQYSGTYSSYVNGVSTGNGDNVIAAMQGFFVHVSEGTYPMIGTLGVTNSVRVNNLNPVFKSAFIDNRSTLRLTASFEHKNATEDAAVIYFDNAASLDFDQDLDALKMTNTDLLVPNIYSLNPELNQLSINGMPIPSDDISKIPLGITTFNDGWITLSADDINRMPAHLHIYLLDAETGLQRDLRQVPDYRFYLKSGPYNKRFSLVFSQSELSERIGTPGKLFTLIRSGDYLKVKADLPETTQGTLMVTNLLGQIILRREVNGNETVEINQKVNIGVYVLTLVSGKLKHSEKVIMRQDYE